MTTKEMLIESQEVVNEFRAKVQEDVVGNDPNMVFAMMSGAMAVEIVSLRARLKAANAAYAERIGAL